MSERKRVDIKTILADPILREEIMEGATDFICKVEGIRPHSLSPAAQAVLTAITQQEYCLDPSDIPNEAARIGCLVAAALRVLTKTTLVDVGNLRGCTCYAITTGDILDVAAELEGVTSQ